MDKFTRPRMWNLFCTPSYKHNINIWFPVWPEFVVRKDALLYFVPTTVLCSCKDVIGPVEIFYIRSKHTKYKTGLLESVGGEWVRALKRENLGLVTEELTKNLGPWQGTPWPILNFHRSLVKLHGANVIHPEEVLRERVQFFWSTMHGFPRWMIY